MSKKIFTLLVLAVFALAQFSMASAAAVTGATITLTALPSAFIDATSTKISWSVTGMPGTLGASQYIDIYSRLKAVPPAAAVAWATCTAAKDAVNLTDAVGTTTVPTAVYGDGDTVEFMVFVDDTASCGGVLAADADAMGESYVELTDLFAIFGNPPALTGAFGATPVACNTFEMWALASDQYYNGPAWMTTPYSGFDSWNPVTTGTFAGPSPIGPATDLLSWKQTLPSTASGPWTFTVQPTDAAGNYFGPFAFRGALPIVPAENAACADFSDTAGHADEVYVRYLAELGLLAGNPDGTFGPDSTLTRAEASVLFETANGRKATDVGFGTPPTAGSACDFSDVAAADWFSGWVWAACSDGFMNGVGGGMFDPANTLTRGQIVTVLNNAYTVCAAAPCNAGGFLDFGATATVLRNWWGAFPAPWGAYLRQAAWTDVAVGAFYALPVQKAYGLGVADGTSATEFSPDVPVLRGEFAKMLYRALSQPFPSKFFLFG